MNVPQLLFKARNGGLPARFVKGLCDDKLLIWLQMGIIKPIKFIKMQLRQCLRGKYEIKRFRKN